MEIINYKRERVQNAVLFFVTNAKNVGMTKLCKLLYFCDLNMHLKQGVAITDLEYQAEKRGPVPMAVYRELNDYLQPEEEGYGLKDFIHREPPRRERAGDDERFFVPNRGRSFDPDFFSKNELDVLNETIERYRDSLGTEMSAESHLAGKPWELTWQNGRGESQKIDLNRGLELNTDPESLKRIRERQERRAYVTQYLESL